MLSRGGVGVNSIESADLVKERAWIADLTEQN